MNDMLRAAAQRLDRRDFLKVTGAGLAAAALPGIPAALAQDAVELTFWAWCPGSLEMSQKFMEKYPNIKVKYENVGQGAPHYVKLRDALKAGTGLPDVAQMEFNSIASFRALEALEDMGTVGANDVKGGFVDWTWKSASDGDQVFGIPWDSGPMGLLYRDDIFSASGIAVPETWDAYAEAALKLAKDNRTLPLLGPCHARPSCLPGVLMTRFAYWLTSAPVMFIQRRTSWASTYRAADLDRIELVRRDPVRSRRSSMPASGSRTTAFPRVPRPDRHRPVEFPDGATTVILDGSSSVALASRAFGNCVASERSLMLSGT